MQVAFLTHPSKQIKAQWRVVGQHNLRSWLQIRQFRSVSRQTHYEILRLERNCTTREIRTAFVKLSKEIHPDRNPTDATRHAKFVRLNEAYTVLVKSEARQQYDRSLDLGTSYQNVAEATHYKAWHDQNRNKFYEKTGFWDPEHKPSQGGSYYGIKGLPKVSNSYIVFACCIFIFMGIVMHYLAIRYANRVSQEAQDRKDQLCSRLYQESKDRALYLGSRDLQIEMLERRLESNEAKNPQT